VGILTGITRSNHPFKYPVETIEDLRILKKIWENTKYVLRTKGCEETYERIDKLIGDSGLYIPTVEPSALQTLLEEDIGMENFYYMFTDYPDEVTELVELIHDRRRQQYHIIAEQMPYIGCISVESTSTSYICPDIYRQFSQRHMADFVAIMHEHGKKGILHMCGLVNNLLSNFVPTALDGIHALTPPPIGDTNIEHALDVLGDGLFILTAVGNNVLYPNYDPDVLYRELREAITPRLKRSNVLFGMGADGITMPLDHFFTFGEWFQKNGEL